MVIQKEINFFSETYDGIPLSIIYNQIIRFLKEKGIYVPYLEISLPQTKLGNYESFINLLIKSNCAEYLIRHFFTAKSTMGRDFEKYGICMPKFNHNFSAFHFLHNINREWLRQLTVLSNEYEKQ